MVRDAWENNVDLVLVHENDRERSGCANANCYSCKGGGGGAVYVSAYASASDWDGFYARNAANQGLGYYENYAGGGAVYVDSKGAFSGSNTMFDTNEAANGGEEVYLEEVNTTLTLSCPSLMPTSMSGEECNYCAGTSRCVPWPTPQPSAVPTPVPVPRPTVNNVMTDSNIRTAVAAWLADAAAAEALYGHISTWVTSAVTDMSRLFAAQMTMMMMMQES